MLGEKPQKSDELKMLIDQIPMGISFLSLELSVLSLNPHYLDILGVTANYAAGRKCYRLIAKSIGKIPKEAKSCTNCPVTEALKTGQSQNFINIISSDFILETTIVPLKDKSGKINGILELVQDMARKRKEGHSQKKKAEPSFGLASHNDLEEKIAERTVQLKEMADMFQTVIDAIPDHIFFKDTEGRLLLANEATAKAWGRDKAELLGKKDEDFMPADFANACRKSDQKALKNREVVQTQEVGGEGDEKKYFDAIKIPLYDEKGRAKGLVGVGREITGRILMENALKDSEKKYRTIFDTAQDALFLLKIKDDGTMGNYLEVNAIACQRYGYSKEEFLKMSPRDILLPEELKKIQKVSQSLFKTGSTTFEINTKSRDGLRIPVEINAHLFTLGDEKFVLSISRNATERKKAVAQLKKSEQRLKESQEVAKIGSWNLDVVNNILEWSEETFRRFDVDPKTFTTSVEYFIQKIHPDDREATTNAIQDAMENDTPYHVEPRIINDSGREWVMEAYGKAERDQDGKPIRFGGTAQDVTERKVSEEKLQKSHARLLTVLNGLDAIVYAADMNTYEILFANKYVEDVIGGVEGKKCWQSLQVGQTGPCSFCTNQYLLDENGNPKGEYQWEFQNTVNGRWYSLNDRAIQWIDGRIVRLEVAVDITESKKAHEAITKNEEFLNTVIDGIAEPIMIIGTDYKVRRMNRIARKIAGLPENFAGPLLCHQVSHKSEIPCSIENHQCPLHDVVKTGKPFSVVHIHKDRENNDHFVEILASPLFGTDGTVDAIIESSRDITDYKKAEDEIIKSLEEKEVLLREVHHRVKNNMAIISSLLELQSMNIKDDDIRSTFKESRQRIKSMALVHEKLYKSKNFKHIDVKEYIFDLVNDLLIVYGFDRNNIQVTLDVSEIFLDLDVLVPLGLIINELVTNALKHAYANIEKPLLELKLIPDSGNQAELMVGDNGIGLPDDKALAKMETLGVSLIHALSIQLGGRLEIKRENGTRFSIYFSYKR